MNVFRSLIFDFRWTRGQSQHFQFLKICQNRQISKVFCCRTFKFSAKDSNFVPIRVQTNRVSIIIFVPSSLIRYLSSAVVLRPLGTFRLDLIFCCCFEKLVVKNLLKYYFANKRPGSSLIFLGGAFIRGRRLLNNLYLRSIFRVIGDLVLSFPYSLSTNICPS